MGWFWADAQPVREHTGFKHPHMQGVDGAMSPPPSCPMHRKTVDAIKPPTTEGPPAPRQPAAAGGCSSTSLSACPVPHASRSAAGGCSSTSLSACPVPHASRPAAQESSSSSSTLSKLNPLNYMPYSLSQKPAPNQTIALPTTREESSIPRGAPGSGEGNWEYPSPQQMYNALLRKGYTDTDATAVESMVAVHNFLNEGAWAEILEWERRFGRGLYRGWRMCRKGEARVDEMEKELMEEERGRGPAAQRGRDDGLEGPRLLRFQGRPREMTPKAALVQLLGRVYPSKFATEPPFDRHDWYVSRTSPSPASATDTVATRPQTEEIRYVIDYYAGPPEPTGEPVFYLDVRPAIDSPARAAERLLRWGCDVWWRASGGDVREMKQQQQQRETTAA